MARLTPQDINRIWELYEADQSLVAIGEAIGRRSNTVRDFLIRNRWQRPKPTPEPSGAFLTAAQREEISRGVAMQATNTAIAASINRSQSTVSRELSRNGGRAAYRATQAHAHAAAASRRPKPKKLDTNEELRGLVEAKIEELWSPEQIAGWLSVNYSGDPSMQVSHETIYQGLYHDYHGTLDSSLWKCLRQHRMSRAPQGRRSHTKGKSKIRDIVSIHTRDKDVEDRTEFGHWEGDLIIGSKITALATLVERVSRVTVCISLPGTRTAEALNTAITAKLASMGHMVVRSITWDQGHEIAAHKELKEALGAPVFICDRKSPWQRGTNENTNGLLRQWWPRSTDFYRISQAEADVVAGRLNDRPRKTLGWRTPAEVWAEAA